MIIKLPDGSYQLRSQKGRKMGTYENRYRAKRRLKQIEMFKHKDEDKKESVQEGYYSQLAAGLIDEEPRKKPKLTQAEKDRKKEQDNEFRKKFIVPLGKGKKRKSISESVAGIAAPDMRVNGSSAVGLDSRDNKIMRPPMLKINIKSEFTTDLNKMYGSALEKGKEDKDADSAAKKYLQESTVRFTVKLKESKV